MFIIIFIYEFLQNTFNLSLSEKNKHLNQKTYVDKLQEELINHFNKKINLEIKLGNASNSPLSEKKVEKAPASVVAAESTKTVEDASAAFDELFNK